MPDRDKSTLPIDSDAVDAEFWALVLHDEELLRAQFDEITEPAEARISPPCAIPVAADQSSSSGERPRAPDRGVPDRLANATRPRGHGWRRERSPPDGASPHEPPTAS